MPTQRKPKATDIRPKLMKSGGFSGTNGAPVPQEILPDACIFADVRFLPLSLCWNFKLWLIYDLWLTAPQISAG